MSDSREQCPTECPECGQKFIGKDDELFQYADGTFQHDSPSCGYEWRVGHTTEVSAKPKRIWPYCEHGNNMTWHNGGKCVQPSNQKDSSGTKIEEGFMIRIKCHTADAFHAITSPEALRFMVGHMLDSWKLQEEIDYTLEVTRTYEQQ